MSEYTYQRAVATLEAENARLTKENQELRADGNGIPTANMPVKHYTDGMIYAVYGSSSISYVEFLRAERDRLAAELTAANEMCASAYGSTASEVLAENARLAAELAEIDMDLARRSALDGCTTRRERISLCIAAAATADPGALSAKLAEASKEAGKWRSDFDAEREAHAQTQAELAIEAKSALLCNDALVAERRDVERLSELWDWLESEHARACEKAEAFRVAGDDRSWQDWYGRAVPFGEVLTKIKELDGAK